MQKSKLVDIIKLLNREELQSFQQYLASPYFDQKSDHQQIQLLFQHIYNHITDLTHPALTKSATFKAVFPRKKFSSQKMDKLMSELLQVLTQFIGFHHTSIHRTFIPQQIELIKFLHNRNAPNHANYYLKKLKRSINNLTLIDRDYYFNKYLIELEEFEQMRLKETKIQQMDHLRAMQSLDIFYLINKLEYACYLLSEDRFRKPVELKGLIDFIDNIKIQFSKNGSLEHPIVNLYFNIYELLKSTQAEDLQFTHIQELIDQEIDNISFSTLKAITTIMRNAKIIQYNLGKNDATLEMFRMYQKHLEQGFLDYDNGILPSIYKNIVTMGLRAKEFKWVHQFIQEYKDKLIGIPDNSEFYHYNLAHYHFAVQEYDQALELIMKSYDEIYLKIAAKTLELKILLETQSEILASRIDAFKLFIYRLSASEIIVIKKKSITDFINILRQIAQPQNRFDQKKLIRIKEKVEQNKTINEKEWLLNRLKLLIKK